MMTATKKQTQQKPSAARVDSGISINPSHQRGLQEIFNVQVMLNLVEY